MQTLTKRKFEPLFEPALQECFHSRSIEVEGILTQDSVLEHMYTGLF